MVAHSPETREAQLMSRVVAVFFTPIAGSGQKAWNAQLWVLDRAAAEPT